MNIELTAKEIEFIRIGIEVAQFESQLPETDQDKDFDIVTNLLAKLGKNEWRLVVGGNYFTLVEQYQCSECGTLVSGGPPERCPTCDSTNEYRGKCIAGWLENAKE